MHSKKDVLDLLTLKRVIYAFSLKENVQIVQFTQLGLVELV